MEVKCLYVGAKNTVSGSELLDLLYGDPTVWAPSRLPSGTCNAEDLTIHGPELQESGVSDLCVPPSLLQWPICPDGVTMNQGSEWTPFPVSPLRDKTAMTWESPPAKAQTSVKEEVQGRVRKLRRKGRTSGS